MPTTRHPEHLNEPKFFTTARTNTNPNWRIQITQNQLVSQASTILLQRHTKFWAPLLKPLKFSSNFTPIIFHQILNKIQTHPKICLNFFNWAQKTLDFKPDLKAQCEVTRILLGSEPELSKFGKPILNSIVQDYPPAKVVPLLITSRKSADFINVYSILNSVIECYCSKDMYFQCLEVYQMARQYGFGLSVDTCNALLNLLCDKNELRFAWCYYASIVRTGISGDQFTWSVIARILRNDGKFERVSRILNMGIYTREMFDLMIDGYSKRGDFEAGFSYLNEMSSKGIEPSFSTYSSMLDGACRYQDRKVIEIVMSLMIEKGYIPEPVVSDYDLIIQKLCDLGKTFAVDLFFERASDEKIELQDSTYRCMFRALLSEEGRTKDAIKLYDILKEKNVLVNESCYNEFVIVLCRENPSKEVSKLIVDIVREGFCYETKELSEYICRQCAEGRWREAEELLNVILDQRCLLDPLCCGSFVKWFCSNKQIDRAIMLHNKLEGLKGFLDTTTYNVLLASLFRERRIDDTIKVFEYMKTCKVLNSESFTLMIRGLCHEKELRKAMRLHDEMLELGLKPDRRTYKRLISGFR
ncbi:hypothetical protein BUALT_Bualt03G0073200 [Buddleja alternifolia]|uniref:Pentatricopeptide repeat-containing protein n=1 Tax=Buddleja alternifolia TaxID=168488 RepID=A0AAV6XYI5_9LAMI|nr:hypothetical protein BUALT_Bualt03G0073200 [Buddleja alternifolia]